MKSLSLKTILDLMLQKLFLEGTRETGMGRGWPESLMMTQGLLRQHLSTDILEGWKRSPMIIFAGICEGWSSQTRCRYSCGHALIVPRYKWEGWEETGVLSSSGTGSDTSRMSAISTPRNLMQLGLLDRLLTTQQSTNHLKSPPLCRTGCCWGMIVLNAELKSTSSILT